jgi:DNA-binding CsgD family transcriptional regulator
MAEGQQAVPELVGRAREVAALERALREVSAGATWTVEVVGEPGIGKSRILLELCQRADRHRFLVLEGRAAEFEHDIPFGVIVDALNDYLGSLEPAVLRSLDGDTVHELAAVFPSLSAQRDDLAGARAATSRYRAHYAVRALLERLAKRGPLMLALDDLHWADEASIEVIAHLLRRFNGPLLLGLAFRQIPSGLRPATEANARSGSASRLVPAPLTADEAAALLGPELDASTRDRVFLESGGNPFYLEQLARADPADRLPVSRLTRVGEDGWSPPPALASAVSDELGRVAEHEQRLLSAAAVAGESFDPWLLSAIADLDEQTVLAALDSLMAVDLLRTSSLPRNFRFRHPIVRRVVYETTPAGWRILAHGRAAAALADARASDSEIAHHLALSARPGDEHAAAQLSTAARAVAARAPMTAGRWLLAAAALLPHSETESRVRLLDEAAASLTSAGAFADALAALDEALSLTSEDDHELKALLATDRSEARRRGGRPFESQEQLEQALRSLPPDSELFVDVSLELAMDRYWHGDFARIQALVGPLLEPGQSRATRPDGGLDRLDECLACSLLSLVASYEERPREADDLLDEALTCFAALGDDRLAERIYLGHYIGEAALCRERVEHALRDVRRCLEVSRRTGQEATSSSWLGVEMHALLLNGQVRDAARVTAESDDPTMRDDDDWRMTWLLGPKALAAAQAGDHERSLSAASEMVARSTRSHNATILPLLSRVQLGGALLASGDPQGALRELEPLEHDAFTWVLDLNGAYGWTTLIRANIAVGAPADAQRCAGLAETRAGHVGLPGRGAAIRCASSALALESGDAASAADTASDALALAGDTENPVLVARARAALGAALVQLGDRARAVRELEAAESALLDCGALREADAAARELRRLGKRVTRPGRGGHPQSLPALTRREREVAGEVAAGKSNREVAQTLFLSEKTIESHLARIFGKLDIHSRAALAAIVARQEPSNEAPR